jgi:hypothetical protein
MGTTHEYEQGVDLLLIILHHLLITSLELFESDAPRILFGLGHTCGLRLGRRLRHRLRDAGAEDRAERQGMRGTRWPCSGKALRAPHPKRVLKTFFGVTVTAYGRPALLPMLLKASEQEEVACNSDLIPEKCR